MNDRPPTDNERALLAQIESLKAELERARELAAWFRDDNTRTLPVVANFRLWRMGHQDSPTFHANLRGDSCGKAISLGPVVPIQAMGELNDWCARKESMERALEDIDRSLRDLRGRRGYLLDARKGTEDPSRAMQLRQLDVEEEVLLKRRAEVIR